jgi:hypothetical protein
LLAVRESATRSRGERGRTKNVPDVYRGFKRHVHRKNYGRRVPLAKASCGRIQSTAMKKRTAKTAAPTKPEPEIKVEFWCPRDGAVKMVRESDANWQQTCPNEKCRANMVRRG